MGLADKRDARTKQLSGGQLRRVVHTHGSGIAATDLLIVAAWGIAALLIAVRTFQWSPRSG